MVNKNTEHTALISAENITKTFPLPEENRTYTALKDLNLTVHSGEVVALLGRSGSGKTTLLRILAGLIPASSGVVKIGDEVVEGPTPDMAMVFQSFALLPWATVQENVELGLKARGVSREERRARAREAIDLVGLHGFESAYPKELSGGMQQRVGIARAFVTQPKVLFMDEPFSGLDVLTAENLRGEIGRLWAAGNFPAKSILIVTHSIEEAVVLADRVVVMGADPGCVRGEVKIELPRPRERHTAEFMKLVDYIYIVMTNPELDVQVSEAEERFPPLPHARAGGISGLLELLVEHSDQEDLPVLARHLHLGIRDLLPIVDAAVMLGFAELEQGNVRVTQAGKNFAQTDILSEKAVFRQQLLQHIPLAATIYNTLHEKDNRTMKADFFLDILDEQYPAEEAQRQFETVVDWGRYAELFEYDAGEKRLHLLETAPAR